MAEKTPADLQAEIGQLTLTHIQEFRSEFRTWKTDISEELKDIKFRLRKIEETVTHHTTQFDRVQERLNRIENRLELVEA
jgi:septation ring formation regulator EzrA